MSGTSCNIPEAINNDEFNKMKNLLKNPKELRESLNREGLQRTQREAFIKHLNNTITRILLLFTSSQDKENVAMLDNIDKKDVADMLHSAVAVFLESAKDKQFPPFGLNQIVSSLYNLLNEISCEKIKNSISQLCELWWNQNFDGKNAVIRNVIFFLLKRAMDKQVKADIKRVTKLIEYLKTVDLKEDEIIIIIKCTTSNFILSFSEGRRLVSSFFLLSSGLLPQLQTAVKMKLTEYNNSRADAYGEIYYNAWRLSIGEKINAEMEEKCIQDVMFHCIHASKEGLAQILRKVLGCIHKYQDQTAVRQMLIRLYRPILWRSLKVANANVRANAAALFFILFPLIDPNAKRVEAEEEIDKQLLDAADLLNDNFPNVRIIAIEGVCHICHKHWESFDNAKIKSILEPLVKSLVYDASSSMVRVAVFKGFSHLLENVMCHGAMKVLLSPLQNCLFDISENVCIAFLDMLLSIKGRRTIKFWDIVPAEKLLIRLENGSSNVNKRIVVLLMDAYHPSNKEENFLIKRSIKLITEYPAAYYNFYFELARMLTLEDAVFYMLVVRNYLKSFCGNLICKAVEEGELDFYIDPNDSDEDGIRRVTEETESIEDNDLHFTVIKGLLEVVSIIWMTRKRDLENEANKNLTSTLQGRYAVSMTKFFKVLRHTEALKPLIYICGFLPARKVQNSVSYCLAKLRSLPNDATEEIYAHMLESMCNWNRGDELIESIIEWLEFSFETSSSQVSNKKLRSGKTVRFEEPSESRPDLGLQFLSYLLTSPVCRRRLLNNFRPQLETLFEVLKKSQNLLQAILNKELSDDHISVEFLQRAFFLAFELSMHLQDKNGESTVNVVDYLSKLLAWIQDTVLVSITNNAEHNTSETNTINSSRFRSHNLVGSSVISIASEIILSVSKQLSITLVANVCGMNLVPQIAHLLTTVLSNELLMPVSSDNLIIYLLRLFWRLEEYCLANNKEDTDSCLTFIPDVFKAFINIFASHSKECDENWSNMIKFLKTPFRELLRNFQRYTFLVKSLNEVMKTILNASLTECSSKLINDFDEDQMNSVPNLTFFLWSHISTQPNLLNIYLEELKRSIDSLNFESVANVGAVICILHLFKKKRKNHGAATKEIIFRLEEEMRRIPINLNNEQTDFDVLKISINSLKKSFDLQ